MTENTGFKEEFNKSGNYWKEKIPHEKDEGINEFQFPSDYHHIQENKRQTYSATINEETTKKLENLSKNKDILLYIVLLSAFKVFIFKYLGQEDISIGAPVYSKEEEYQEKEGQKLILFRDVINQEMTFKEVLKEVRRTVILGYEYQYVLQENNLDLLGLKISETLLTRYIFLLENNHKKEYLKAIEENPENDMTISFKKGETTFKAQVIYNSNRFSQDTIEIIWEHYMSILDQVLLQVNLPLKHIEKLLPTEKENILFQFNRTQHPFMKTSLQELFEKQVEKNRDRPAVMGEESDPITFFLTYHELDLRSLQITTKLNQQGKGANEIVGILLESGPYIVISLLGILKAGAAYMPIDPLLPPDRIQYLVQDSQVRVLIQQEKNNREKNLPGLYIPGIESILVDQRDRDNHQHQQLEPQRNQPNDLLYLIYTSGTTGVPRGVLVEHKGILNYINWRIHTFRYSEHTITLQMLPCHFDGFGSNFFPTIFSGGTLYMVPEEKKLEPKFLGQTIKKARVTNMSVIPSMYQMILERNQKDAFTSLKWVVLAGEKSNAATIRESMGKAPQTQLINEYGPTEATIACSFNSQINKEKLSVIGKPIWNTQIYIMDYFRNDKEPVPLKVYGECWVSGTGVTRGYLNSPEATAEKFINHNISKEGRLYRTGDVVRWLPGGNLELKGRIDHQVKIRGYRIEPAEIEKHLLDMGFIKEAVVLDSRDKNQDLQLCACIELCPGEQKKENRKKEIREYLSGKLPPYMIPAFYMILKKIPRTGSGKINRKLLPEIQYTRGEVYTAPGNKIEILLAEIWEEVLGMPSHTISIHDNFFELGGHSLKATIMAEMIHKSLKVKIPLIEVFKSPTIKNISRMLETSSTSSYTLIHKVEEKEYYPLSSAQKRLYLACRLEPNTTSYNLPMVLLLEGTMDLEKFQDTFERLIDRHESLRTSIMEIDHEPVQKIHTTASIEFKLGGGSRTLCKDDQEIKEKILNFIAPFDFFKSPLFRAEIITTNLQRHILMVDMHHIISDGISHHILEKDFSEIYFRQKQGALKLQYRDFSEWQYNLYKTGRILEQEKYWKHCFKESVPVLELPLDYPRPNNRNPKRAGVKDFYVNKQLYGQIHNFTKQTGTTLFMFLLGVYYILLYFYTGQKEVVVGATITGRRHTDLQGIIGMFVNMLALMNNLEEKETFKGFLSRVKSKVVQGMENQDYPFDHLVKELDIPREPGRNPIFNVVFNMTTMPSSNMNNTDLKASPETLKVSPYPFQHTASVFDMILTATVTDEIGEQQESIPLRLIYSTELFHPSKIKNMTDHFKEILQQGVENPDILIQDIKISHQLKKASQILRPKEANIFDF